MFFSLLLVSKQRAYVSGVAQSVTLASNQALRGGRRRRRRRRHRRTSWRRICNYANKRRPERTANGRRREKGREPEVHNEFVRSRRRRARRRKRRRGPRTKGRGRDTRRKRGGRWKRMEKDEEDEEGDHGSIVAFRIPCRPSVDFRPLPLRSPLQLLQPTCTPCSSPPPFVPTTTVLVIPQSPLPFSSPRTIPRLARGPQPSTVVAYLHRRRARVVTQAQTHRPDIRLSLLPSPPFPSSSLFSSPSFISASRLTLYFSRAAFSPSQSSSLFLFTSCRFPSRRIAASEGEARAAQSRSVA